MHAHWPYHDEINVVRFELGQCEEIASHMKTRECGKKFRLDSTGLDQLLLTLAQVEYYPNSTEPRILVVIAASRRYTYK